MNNIDEMNLDVALDFRHQKENVVTDDQVFYAVHRVTAGESTWMRHNAILADNVDSINEAMMDIRDVVKKTSGGQAKLIYIGSMVMMDPELSDDAQQQDVNIEIQGLRASDSQEYSVFGIIGTSQIILMSVRAVDAIDAATSAANRVQENFGQSFAPLDVSLCDTSIDYSVIEANLKRLGQFFAAKGSVLVH